jgi:hypothetical protein
VLVVIPQTVHILVSALTITDTTSKWPKPALCFPFDFAHLALGDTLIFLPSSLAGGALASQQCLYLLEVLGRRKVTAAVGHVIFKPISLLVTFVAIRLRAAEGLR